MAVKCPKCGAEFDVTLFAFGRAIQCDCGEWVDLTVGHQQTANAEDGTSQEMTMPLSTDERRVEETKLLATIREALPRLEELWQQSNSHWGYEDPVYRFYHQSMKVYFVQAQTAEIVQALRDLAPHLPLNPRFTQIVDQGTAEPFSPEVNEQWLHATRPILEAFFHARFFLDMACRYGRDLQEPPDSLVSGWAALLYLYGLR